MSAASRPDMASPSSYRALASKWNRPSREAAQTWLPPRLHRSLAVLATLATLSCATLAQLDAPSTEVTVVPALDGSHSILTATPPVTTMSVPSWEQATDAALKLRLRERDNKGDDDVTSTEGSGKSKASTILTISVDRPTTTASPTADVSQSPLPSPFDNNIPSDFKLDSSDNRCPNFMSRLLSDPTFKRCYPISMLVQTSRGFFDAEKKLLSIVRVLDAACKADVSTCTDFLSQAAQNLTTEANCKAEIDQRQSLVLEAWRGLKAYEVLYKATCLQDNATSMYCFANAVTNLTTPSDSFLYFVPFGLALPGSSTPSCNWCNKETMAIYRAASADRQQFVADKYEPAARQINAVCGPNFVNGTLPAAQSAAGVALPPSYTFALAGFLVLAALL
ncbi:hypothetical protein Purlil1_3006 [Purpureocillium lilacinum]|uniref:DUF7729 domain-containing protein n=2 Tax=Purpureocillium lilacinum TaxID=33203 RepID=A0ABR0C818_PURLI|nr:hypothetical protein Purlil1_3006 [Purpureocillium lilacinum]